MKKINSPSPISFFMCGISALSFFIPLPSLATTTRIVGSSTPRVIHATSSQDSPEVRATINLSGTIETVDLGTKTITARINAVYGRTSGTARLGFTLAPQTSLSLSIPQGIPLSRLNIPIALVDLKPGNIFTARAIIDRDTHIGIVQAMHVSSPEAPLPFIIGTILEITPRAITVKTSSTTEQQFAIMPQTNIYTDGKAGLTNDLNMGRNVALSFTLNGNAMEAVIIEISWAPLTQNRTAIIFLLHTLIARGERAVDILDASLYRLNNIIIKQENLAAHLKQNEKDISSLESLISLSRQDLTSAQSLLTNASKTFHALLRSSDPKKDALTAHDQLVVAVGTQKNIFADIMRTQAQLRTLSH